MSVDVQLEFNIENKSADELRAEIMQKQIDALSDSLTKVRKKLFAEVGALKKILGDVQPELTRVDTCAQAGRGRRKK